LPVGVLSVQARLRKAARGRAAKAAVISVAGTGVLAFLVGGASPAPARGLRGRLPIRTSPNLCFPGTGSYGWCGDGGKATAAKLAGPRDVGPIATGGFFVADTGNQVIRRVDRFGYITTVAGTGDAGYSGDGGLAIDAELDEPTGVSAIADGGFVIADRSNSVIRRVFGDGRIETIAGVGKAGFSGDGDPASKAELNLPRKVVPVGNGTYLIADTGNERIRRISQAGTISTVAGTGTAGFSGDGGLATAAELNAPTDVAPTGDGGFLIADRGNSVVRLVSPDGKISTVAGGGGSADRPESATSVLLNQPISVASTGDGRFVVAEAGMIRRVLPNGDITVVAGKGLPGFTFADIAEATDMGLSYPTAIAAPGDGSFLVSDSGNDRIRRLSPSGQLATKAGSDRPQFDPANARGLVAGDQGLGFPHVPAAPPAGANAASPVREHGEFRPATPLQESPRYPASCKAYKPQGNVFTIEPPPAATLHGRKSKRFGVKFTISADASMRMALRNGAGAIRSPARRFRAGYHRKLRLARRVPRGTYVLSLEAHVGNQMRCVRRSVVIR
jgi:hypothetical protein